MMKWLGRGKNGYWPCGYCGHAEKRHTYMNGKMHRRHPRARGCWMAGCAKQGTDGECKQYEPLLTEEDEHDKEA